MSMLNYIKKSFPRIKNKLFLLGYKQLDVSKIEITFEKRKSEISFFPLSSNTIKVFDYCGKKFFRECRQHASFDAYVKKAFNEFYYVAERGITQENFYQKIPIQTHYSINEINLFRSYIDKCMKKPDFFVGLKQLNFLLKECQFNIWENNKIIPQKTMDTLGFSDLPENMTEIFVYFISFIKAPITNHCFHSFLKNTQYETFFANKTLATFQLAKLLGLERLITPAKFVKVTDENDFSLGVMCDKAPGIRAYDSQYEMTPSLHRELTNLQVLDALCLQPDHWVNNYNIVPDINGFAVSVCAFDNDNMWTFMPFHRPSFFSKCDGAPILNKKGLVNLPHLEKETAMRILEIHPKEINKEMKSYLNFFQLKALCHRFQILQNAIKKTCNLYPDFLVESNKWSANLIKTEIQGMYGKTYSWQYLNKEQTKNAERQIKKDFKLVW